MEIESIHFDFLKKRNESGGDLTDKLVSVEDSKISSYITEFEALVLFTINPETRDGFEDHSIEGQSAQGHKKITLNHVQQLFERNRA